MVSLRIIIYSGMLGLPLMLMSFYLGQNVLMIVDVLTLVFLRIWGLIASVVLLLGSVILQESITMSIYIAGRAGSFGLFFRRDASVMECDLK